VKKNGLNFVFQNLKNGIAGYFDDKTKTIFINEKYSATRILFIFAQFCCCGLITGIPHAKRDKERDNAKNKKIIFINISRVLLNICLFVVKSVVLLLLLEVVF